ncbi:MAG: LUD domain-containing protein [Spirochaetes bacterium]|nr:LUD domain-containing protein [Spirochaetota bacterium]
MKSWNAIPPKEVIEKTIAALAANGIEAVYAENGAAAREKVLGMIPKGAEVMTMASVTVDSIGLGKAINESGVYDAVKPRLYAMDQKTQGREMRKYGSAPDVSIGSVHALTEGGTLVIASLTGSQLPAYAYAAGTAIWVVGANKIVKDVEEGLKRIDEHVVPLESVRARKAYGLPESFNSFPAKVLLFRREVQPGRAKVVIVGEVLGF